MSSPAPVRHVKQGQREDARRRILAAAREVIGRDGAAGAHLEEIAGRAGVARAAIHHYFGGKARLLAAVLEDDAERWALVLEQQVAPVGSLQELVAAVGSLVQRLVDDRASHVVWLESDSWALRDCEVRATRERVNRRWRERFGQLLAEKAADRVIQLPADAMLLATLLTALGQSVAREASIGEWDHAAALPELQRLVSELLDPSGAAER